MERLREKAAAFGIKLSDHQLEQFETYYEMLVEKNKSDEFDSNHREEWSDR